MRLSRPAVVALVAGTVLALAGATMTGAAAAAPRQASAAAATPGSYVALTPHRLLDTRSGQGGHEAAAHGSVTLRVTGAGGVPATGAGAVVLTVTVPSPSAGGYVTVYPAGSSRPTASTLNFSAGHTVANLALARVGTHGDVVLYNGSTRATQLVVDVSGYYVAGTPAEAGAFQALAPSRILDTRTRVGGTEPAGHGQVVLTVAGAGGVPASGVGAVALNLTATGATAGGPISVYPDDGAYKPQVSSLNLVAGATVADAVVVSVPANGKIVVVNGSAKPVQLVADVTGYFTPGQSHVPGTLNATAPARVLDTRNGIDDGYAEPGAHGVVALRPTGQDSLPPTGVRAVLLTVTVTAAQHNGYLTAYAGGTARPSTSNLNFRAGQSVANLVIAPISSAGVVDLYNGSAGKAQIIADVDGYYSALPNPWTASTPALPSGQSSQGITGVSCPTSTACVSVGVWSTQTPSFQVGPLIETLAGGTWTRTEQSPPSATVERKLTAVSCVSAASCTAVGYDSHDDDTGDSPSVLPVVDTLADGEWTATELLPPPAPEGDEVQSAQLTGVSCTSATACVAVGSYATGFGGTQILVETLTGTAWAATELPAPDDSAELDAVSCTSDAACVAVGDTGAVGASSIAVIETLANGKWTVDTTLASTAAAKAAGWSGVSCPAAGECVAVSDNGVAATLAGGHWTGATMPRGLTAVSCSAITACTAVGSYFADRAGDSQPLTAELQATTWTPFGLPRPIGSGQLLSVSCPGPQSCVASGNAVVYQPGDVLIPPLLESDLAG